MGRLAGRVALVTGGGTGIGKGIARCFLEEGASVVIAQRRLETAMAAVAELDHAKRVRAYQADIRRRAQAHSAVAYTCGEFGRIDVLVNNAALTGRRALRPFLALDQDFIDEILDVNLKGTIYASEAAARAMKEQGRGVILHISSVGAFAAQEGASLYCAGKAALSGLTQAMALELAPFGIRVNSIAPGDIETERNREIQAEMRDSGVSGSYFRRIPAGRRGTPDEVGRAAVFLACDDSSYVIGETLMVDGGFLIY